MEKIIVNATNTDFNRKLEKAFYEVKSRANVISFMLSNPSYDETTFKSYHDDYVNKTIEYERLKKETSKVYNLAQYGEKASWNFNFEDDQIVVTIHD